MDFEILEQEDGLAKEATTPYQSVLTKRVNFGKPAKITDEIVDRVAERVASGLPLRLALSLDTEYLPEGHWTKSVSGNTRLNAIFEQKIAHWVYGVLKDIKGCNSKELPVGSCWILERRLPEYFSLNKSTSQVNVNVNVAGLADDVVKRAASLVRRKPEKIIDVESTPVKSTRKSTKGKT